MKQKVYRVVFPVTLVVVLAVLVAAILFIHANYTFAADKKKLPEITRISAVEYTEARIKEIERSLKITEAQQALWNDLTAVMRENAQDMDNLSQERAEGNKPMNAVEHMKFHMQVTEAHLAQLKKLIVPFEAFYGSLSDEQQSTIDTIFRTGKYENRKKK